MVRTNAVMIINPLIIKPPIRSNNPNKGQPNKTIGVQIYPAQGILISFIWAEHKYT